MEMKAKDRGYKSPHIDFVDKFILKYACEPIAPLFYLTGHTANAISLYGLFFTIGFLFYLWKDDMLRFSIYFWIAYVLDCLDGYFARRYNMVTQSGDIFEHARDLVSLILMTAICCIRYILSRRVVILTILANALAAFHVGCVQKKFIDRSYFETLDVLRFVCFDELLVSWAPYYGVGTYMTTLYFVVLYLSQGVAVLFKSGIVVAGILYFIGKYKVGGDCISPYNPLRLDKRVFMVSTETIKNESKSSGIR